MKIDLIRGGGVLIVIASELTNKLSIKKGKVGIHCVGFHCSSSLSYNSLSDISVVNLNTNIKVLLS